MIRREREKEREREREREKKKERYNYVCKKIKKTSCRRNKTKKNLIVSLANYILLKIISIHTPQQGPRSPPLHPLP